MKQPRFATLCGSCFFFLAFLSVLVASEAQEFATSRDCPANEAYLVCGGNCQSECASLGAPCLIVHKRCPDGCYCNDGYARNTVGLCIPLERCEKYKSY